MKKILRKLLGHLGYEIRRLDSRIEIDSPWGPNILLYALEDLRHKSSKPLRIVQIGANDGFDQDPLRDFIEKSDCEAVLVEPMDSPFSKLADLYANTQRIKTIQAAIAEDVGVMSMHYIVDAEGNPDLTLFSSFDRETVEKNLSVQKTSDAKYQNHKIMTKSVPTKTLKSLLEEVNMDDIDAVIVDVEGYDHKIVRNFLQGGVEPNIIRYEYCNLSRREFRELRDLLKKKGYEIVRSGIDIYCQKAGLLR